MGPVETGTALGEKEQCWDLGDITCKIGGRGNARLDRGDCSRGGLAVLVEAARSTCQPTDKLGHVASSVLQFVWSCLLAIVAHEWCRSERRIQTRFK